MAGIQNHITGLLLLLLIATGSYAFISGFFEENAYNTNEQSLNLSYFRTLNSSQNQLVENVSTLREQLTSGLANRDFLQTIFVGITAGSTLMIGTILSSIDTSINIINDTGTLLKPYGVASDVFVAIVAVITLILLLNYLFSVLESITKTRL